MRKRNPQRKADTLKAAGLQPCTSYKMNAVHHAELFKLRPYMFSS